MTDKEKVRQVHPKAYHRRYRANSIDAYTLIWGKSNEEQRLGSGKTTVEAWKNAWENIGQTRRPSTVEIEVCERLMDHRQVPHIVGFSFKGMKQAPKYHAQIKGQPGYWSCGDSESEAIGALIRTHPKQFGVNIINLKGKLPR